MKGKVSALCEGGDLRGMIGHEWGMWMGGLLREEEGVGMRWKERASHA